MWKHPVGTLTCSLGTIVAGGSTPFDIFVVVDPGASGLLVNNASVVSDTNDPDPSTNSASEETSVPLVSLPGQTCTESSGSGCPQDITGVEDHTSSFDIDGCGEILDVNVGLDITHDWVGIWSFG